MYLKYLEKVFSDEECLEIGDTFDLRPFVMHGRTRQGRRFLKKSDVLARLVEKKLQVPMEYLGKSFSRVNEMFRIVHTREGEGFRKHSDGRDSYEGETTMLTVLIYLTDADGPTRVWENEGGDYEDYQCKKGSVLVMDHNYIHEGMKVKSGEKITARTTVFYK